MKEKNKTFMNKLDKSSKTIETEDGGNGNEILLRFKWRDFISLHIFSEPIVYQVHQNNAAGTYLIGLTDVLPFESLVWSEPIKHSEFVSPKIN